MITPRLRPMAEQVMVTTGASAGIGLVTARRTAAQCARVMLVARGRAALAQITEEINAAGETAAYAVGLESHGIYVDNVLKPDLAKTTVEMAA